jgi:DNA polymerase-3 subunit gamma/tau
MRDAINILDQLVAYSNSKITLDDIYKVNGSVSYSDLYELLKAIIDNDKVKIIEFVDNIDKNGKEIGKFVEEMIIFLKDVVLYKNVNYLSSIEMKNDNIKLVSEIYSGRNLYDLIECLNNAQNVIKFSTHGSIVFLTSILKFSDMNYGKEVEIISREINEPQKMILKEKSASKNDFEAVNKIDDKEENISQEIISKKESNYSEEEVELRINNALALASKDVLKDIKNKWSVIDEYIYEDDYSMAAGILKDCNVVVAASEYVI